MGNNVMVCPKCGSINIETEPYMSTLHGAALMKHYCKDCKYEGHLFPEVDKKNLVKFQKDIKKYNRK